MMLSKNLSLAEVIKSQTAIRKNIDNIPSLRHQDNLIAIAQAVFQPLRDWYAKPITVSSGYRSPQLNQAINGSLSSQHCKGEALDLDVGDENFMLFDYIRLNLDFDQMIWEFGDDVNPAWVHVSYKVSGNRKQILRAVKIDSKTKYEQWQD
jgi:hypothetical protein